MNAYRPAMNRYLNIVIISIPHDVDSVDPTTAIRSSGVISPADHWKEDDSR